MAKVYGLALALAYLFLGMPALAQVPGPVPTNNGISQLTGDCVAGPGIGPQATTCTSIGGKAVNLGGALTLSGANSVTLTSTGPTNVTLPTSGTLAAMLSGITGSIGGGLLAAGGCSSGTVTITGATTSMAAIASPSADPQGGSLNIGLSIYAYVSAANVVTVRVCALVASTPVATTYNVKVIL